jgi:hypothetical protein
MKRIMQKGDTFTFKSLEEFEALEGKITAHSVLGKKVVFWTKDGTYTMPKKTWDKLNTPRAGK